METLSFVFEENCWKYQLCTCLLVCSNPICSPSIHHHCKNMMSCLWSEEDMTLTEKRNSGHPVEDHGFPSADRQDADGDPSPTFLPQEGLSGSAVRLQQPRLPLMEKLCDCETETELAAVTMNMKWNKIL